MNYYTTETVENYLSTESRALEIRENVAENFEDLLELSRKDFSPSMFEENVRNEGVMPYDKLPYFAHLNTEENECRNIALGMFSHLYCL